MLRSASLRTEHEMPVWHRPGRKELMVFVALVVLGLLAWFAGAPGITTRLFGAALPDPTAADLPFPLTFVIVVCGSLALLAGLRFPRGFYLWGLALNLHAPFVEGLTVYMMERDGIGLAGGARGIVGYALLSATLFVFTTFCYTALSALGALARCLSRRAITRR